MIRLNTLRIVGWEFVGQGVTGIKLIDFSHHVPTNHFHQIIAKYPQLGCWSITLGYEALAAATTWTDVSGNYFDAAQAAI